MRARRRALRVDCHVLAGSAAVREALIEQLVDLAIRRLTAVLAD